MGLFIKADKPADIIMELLLNKAPVPVESMKWFDRKLIQLYLPDRSSCRIVGQPIFALAFETMIFIFLH